MTKMEIWNKAYQLLTDLNSTEGARYNNMQSFLREQIANGYITETEKAHNAKDVMGLAWI